MDTDKKNHTLDQATIDLLNAEVKSKTLDADTKNSIKKRLFSRIRSSTMPQATTIRTDQGDWVAVSDKVSVKVLRQEKNSNSQTALWKLAAGAMIPSHTHPVEEECYIISGSVNFGDHFLHQGDFEIFPSGLDHGEMHSDTGALILLRSDIPQDLSWIG